MSVMKDSISSRYQGHINTPILLAILRAVMNFPSSCRTTESTNKVGADRKCFTASDKEAEDDDGGGG